MLHSQLLLNTLRFSRGEQVLLLNSARDPIVQLASQQDATVVLAEDDVSSVQEARRLTGKPLQHLAFHDYILHSLASNMDVAVLNILYQPSNAWMFYGVQLAFYALRPGGRLYVLGAKDRGLLSVGKRMQECFGNLETLARSKGQHVLCSQKQITPTKQGIQLQPLQLFAASKLDEGTSLLLDALEVAANSDALDIGCGAGFVGLYIARRALQGQVTMVDASLAAVAATEMAVAQSDLKNIHVLASDGVQAVLNQRFDLVATNPPFHQGGIQTTEIAARFIRDAARVLRPTGSFYLVANRFLKYEPVLHAHFRQVTEVSGNTRYKVIRAKEAILDS